MSDLMSSSAHSGETEKSPIWLGQEIIDGAAEGIVAYDTELRYRVFNPLM